LPEKRSRMVADWTKCRGCQSCQLICSLHHHDVFNPTKAALRVERLGGETEFGVHFTPDCECCGLCVRYCLYGALSRETDESETVSGVL
jgi:Fe-S-cluster-containing hydrogenase component 2